MGKTKATSGLLLGAKAIAEHLGRPAQYVYDLVRRDSSFARLVTRKTRGARKRRYAVRAEDLESWFIG